MLSNYSSFLSTIKNRIHQAQYDALRTVNKELLNLYRDIGSMIIEMQANHEHGDSVIINLTKDIQKAYPGIK